MYLVIGPYCWGRGETEEAALRNCRQAACGPLRDYVVKRYAGELWMNEAGYLCWRPNGTDEEPETVARYRRGKRVEGKEA